MRPLARAQARRKAPEQPATNARRRAPGAVTYGKPALGNPARVLRGLPFFCLLAVAAKLQRLCRCAVLGAVLLAVAACMATAPAAIANRPDGEGYAGVGELLVRISVPQGSGGPFESLKPHKGERAVVEVRYLGLNSAGRAVFERHDVDTLAGPPVPPRSAAAAYEVAPGTAGALLPLDTTEILLDLRLARQIRIQGKIIEILEASASGVVFRLY